MRQYLLCMTLKDPRQVNPASSSHHCPQPHCISATQTYILLSRHAPESLLTHVSSALPSPAAGAASPEPPRGATRRGEGRAEDKAPPAECSSTSRPSNAGRSGPHPRAPSSRLTCSAAQLQRCLLAERPADPVPAQAPPPARPGPAPPATPRSRVHVRPHWSPGTA